jgi:CxxC-x17-CxxC domain-containing protein
LAECKYTTKYWEYERSGQVDYNCDSKDEDILDSGLFIFHDENYFQDKNNNHKEHEQKVRDRLEAKVRNSIKQNEPLFCIRYHLAAFCVDMRLVSTKDAYDRTAHDRFIIGENIKFNVPSFTTIMKGSFSEIKETTNHIPFIDYWNEKDSLDIVKDWLKIKDILDQVGKRSYSATCSICNKGIEVYFKPDGVRPVYCNNCYKNLK